MADRMNKESVTDWVAGLIEMDGDMCVEPPFTQKSIFWKGSIMSLSRVVCGEKNGTDVDLMLMPVRTCGTPRCANGKHYYWGTRSEARSHKATPRNHSGELNPNSKLNWEIVRDIRARVSAAPGWSPPKEFENLRPTRGTVLSHAQAMSRRELALEYDVSLNTIDKVVTGKIWVEPAPVEKNKDEF